MSIHDIIVRFLRLFRRIEVVEMPRFIALEELVDQARFLLAAKPDDGAPDHHNAHIHLENAVKKVQWFLDNHARELERAIKKYKEAFKL